MLLLIIGALIAVFGVVMAIQCLEGSFFIVFVVGIVIMIFSLNPNSPRWKKGKILESHNLLPIIPKSKIYLVISEDGDMMYKYKDGNKEVIRCTSCHDTLYKEVDKDKTPCFKVQEMKAKITLWAFPIGVTKLENILYIPKSSIEEGSSIR